MKKEAYYVKSLEEDFATKTIIKNKKAVCQTVQDIVKTERIRLNTISFGSEKRLACSILNKNYTKTYRAQGIIFQTDAEPDYIFPFDLALLTKNNKIIVQYYRIKDALHIYYNYRLIKGYEKFKFKDFKKMIEEIPSPLVAWKKVNDFRKSRGYKEMPKSKYKLVEYNEAIFLKPLKIKPIALFGYRKETRKIARELNLPCFASSKQFYNKKIKER